MPAYHSRPVIEERFWSNVQRTDGCWIWTGDTYVGRGYGRLYLGGGYANRVVAHRFSYELHYGPLPDPKLYVCHHCDNRLCVRPDHLFLGTAADNSRDAARKGRLASGEDHPHTSLTEDRVREIRFEYANGRAEQTELATRFGVSQTVISHIVRGETWNPFLHHDLPKPTWKRGLRIHEYRLPDGTRMGRVELAPFDCAANGYSWHVDYPFKDAAQGRKVDARGGKRAVVRAYRALRPLSP